ncbi:GNAT family N-acetyltransferase [Aspergillus foveolatus]|uniref:GNAT family N-acetyltransferase n=1 Tax=Aspergillus foveolatus TaxID=210207 RepID=UPI003CCCA4BE
MAPTPAAVWRNLTASDIDNLMHVANTIHPDLPERAAIFTERVALYPEGCLALVNESGKLHGYAISHPIRHHQPPALDTLLGEIPVDASEYYIHDVAVLPGLRGQGLAAHGIGRLLEVAAAKGFSRTCLVSVYGTETFWGRFGFRPAVVEEELKEKLRGYGDGAVYLTRE